jgi:hypothetical protein
VIAEFLNGRIAALVSDALWSPQVRTTDGIRMLAFQFPRYIPGTDDYDRPLIRPGSTLSQFGEAHCASLKDTSDSPSRYCWSEGPPTRYTLAAALRIDPCPVDAGPGDDDDDSDIPVCDYPKDWYIFGLGVATGKGLKLVHYALSLPHPK